MVLEAGLVSLLRRVTAAGVKTVPMSRDVLGDGDAGRRDRFRFARARCFCAVAERARLHLRFEVRERLLRLLNRLERKHSPNALTPVHDIEQRRAAPSIPFASGKSCG